MALSKEDLAKLTRASKQFCEKNQTYGVDIYDKDRKVEFLDSGSVVINKIIGIGGYPKGRVTEILGEYSSGKTTLALHAIRECQREGKAAIFMDYEHTFDNEYARKLGISLDSSDLLVAAPTTLESGVAYLERVMSEELGIADKFGVIVFDSVAAMIPQAMLELDPSAPGRIGMQAQSLSRFWPKLNIMTRKYNLVVLLLNQERVNLAKAMSPYASGPDVISTGGKSLQFLNSVKIHLKTAKSEREKRPNVVTGEMEDAVVFSRVRASCIKNKVAAPFFRGDFVVRYGTGIDNTDAILTLALASNSPLIVRNGPWCTYKSPLTGEETRFKGGQALKAFILGDKNEYDAINKWFAQATPVALSEDEKTAIIADEDGDGSDFDDGVSLEV